MTRRRLTARPVARRVLARLTSPRLALSGLASLSGWRADLAALGLGALAAAALPPVCAVPVLLVATPGLLALIDGAAGPPRRRGAAGGSASAITCWASTG